MNHIFPHIQGHIRGSFRPRLVPTTQPGGAVPAVYPLDLIAGTQPLRAFSLHRLSASYSGNCLRVVRPSDSETLDVGFVYDPSTGLDIVDLAAIDTFLGAQVGKVDVFYDQMGVGNSVQATDSLRPLIEPSAVAGGPITINGVRPLVFDSDRLNFDGALSVQRRAGNVFQVVENFTSATSQAALFQLGSSTSQLSTFFPASTTAARLTQINPGGNSAYRAQQRAMVYETRMNATNAITSQGAETYSVAAPADLAMVGGFDGDTALAGSYQGKDYRTTTIVFGYDVSAGDRALLRGALNEIHGITESPAARVIFAGDSITVASAASSPYSYGYPKMAHRLAGGTFHSYNVGGGGQQLQNQLAVYSTQIGNILSAYSDNRIVFLAYGTNDFNVGLRTEAQLYANLQTQCGNIRASGGTVIVATVLPATGFDATREARRVAYNANVRTNWASFADGLADFAADSVMGAANAEDDATLYPDGLHPSRLGMSYLAEVASSAISALL